MSSYVITGVSRGIGFEFLRQLSSDPKNTVVGLVRDKAATVKKVEQELPGRKNIHILQADVADYKTLKAAAQETESLIGGKLDYLIANAAALPKWSSYTGLYELGKDPETLDQELTDTLRTNVIGQIHLFNLFLPFILKGDAKKVIAISTGLADYELMNELEIETAGPYAISKTAMNSVVAKYSAELRKDGVMFLSLSPGFVETGQFAAATGEEMEKAGKTFAKFLKYEPDFKGPISPEESVKAMLSVIATSTAEKHGGAFISHKGDKRWL